jgi:NADP-dependent 3-hydroxy acid dehydrogenase YdfG
VNGSLQSLRGRRAFVSGASSGIGAAIARALAADGARVALSARDRASLDAIARDLPGTVVAPCDVRDAGSVGAAMRSAVAALGAIDIVVTAAGVGRFGDVATFAADDWDLVFDVGLRGTFLVVQAALPHVPSTGGDVITICSIAAIRPFPGSAAYCAMKAGVRSFAQVLSAERRQSGVRVTNMVVGSVDTPFWERSGGTALPRDRMLRPADVGRAVAWAAAQPAGTSVDEMVLMPADGVL